MSSKRADGAKNSRRVSVVDGSYAAKAVMAALAVAGRPSGAVLTNPRGLLAPADPYRPSTDAPWKRGDAPFVELPIAVTPGLRLPA